MDLSAIDICENEMAVATFMTGSNTLNPGDVFEYVLHDNATASLGNIISLSNTPEFSFQTGMSYGTTYYISPMAGPDNGSGNVNVNHLCFSIGVGTPVTFYELPEANISGNAVICEGASSDLSFNFPKGIAPFEVVVLDENTNTTFTIDNLDNGAVFSVMPLVTTTYTLVSVTDSSPAQCSDNSSGSVNIIVNPIPQFNNIQFVCNDINTQYQISFEITGGDPASYVVTGDPGTFDNVTNTFTSDFINSGTTYNFQIDDLNNCGPVDVSGNYVCNCTSNAGEMELTLLESCEDEMVSAQHIISELSLDGNDVVGYVLYDQLGTFPASVKLMSMTPDFNYDPTLTYGVTYNISAVVGDDDGTGFPVLDNLIDPCLSISNGQPVVFVQSPEASILGNNTICQGDSTDIVFALTGSGTFNIVYNDEQNNQTLTGISDGHTIRVAPNVTTTYSLVSVDLNSAPFCGGTIHPINSTVTVDVIEIPVVSNVVSNCNQLGTAYTISFEITGGNAVAYNVSGDPGTLAGNIFTSDPILGGSTYTFQVDDGSACPPIVLSATEYCNCTPDIKPAISLNQEISCNGDSDGILNVTNENGATPFNFEWSSGTIGTEAESLSSGWHYVTMTDGNNCTSIDSFFLDEPTAIQADVVTTAPTCFGDRDAIISFENVQGGSGEYSYSIDFYTSFTESSFYNLPAGVYHSTIEDNSGCSWTDTITILAPPEFVIDLGEDVQLELGDSILIDPLASLPINTFTWRASALLDCPDCLTQMVYPMESMRYILEATSDEGCKDSDEIEITVAKERPIFIPNIFSPNGDGYNDILTVYSGAGVEAIKAFRIFDRWGAQVYDVQNVTPGADVFGWDGLLKGVKMASGIYVYYLEVVYIDGKKEIIKGDVVLMR